MKQRLLKRIEIQYRKRNGRRTTIFNWWPDVPFEIPKDKKVEIHVWMENVTTSVYLHN